MANILELIGRIRMDSAQAEGAIGRVTRGTEGLSLSSRKAESAVKNFASIIKSSQEPVTALADSVSNLTRAFGLGVGATVAVVGVLEVIKSFIAESEKLNTVTDKLSGSLKGFRENTETLDFSGAIKQLKGLSAAIEEARAGAAGQEGGFLGRVGKTIADVLGLSEYRLRFTQDLAKVEQNLAKESIKTALQKEIELESVKSINPLEAKRLQIQQKYYDLEKALKSINADKETFLLLQFRKSQDLVNLEEEAQAEKAKSDAEAKKALEERIKLSDQEIKKQEELNEKRNKAIKEYQDGVAQIEERRKTSAGPLLDRIISAASNLGIRGIEPLITSERQKAQRGLDVSALERFGISKRDITARGELFPSAQERVKELVGIETRAKQTEDERLFNSVYGIEQAVMDLKTTIEEKLGVPILRTAT